MCLQKQPSSHFVAVQNSFIIDLYDDNRKIFRNLVVKEKWKKIDDFEENSTDLDPFDQAVDVIPNYFRNVMESMSIKTYLENKFSEKFKAEKNTVCVECYLKGTKKIDKYIEDVMKDGGAQARRQDTSKPDSHSFVKKNRYFISTRASTRIRPRLAKDPLSNTTSKSNAAFSSLHVTQDASTQHKTSTNPHIIYRRQAKHTGSTSNMSQTGDHTATHATTARHSLLNSMFKMESIYGISRSCLRLPKMIEKAYCKLNAK